MIHVPKLFAAVFAAIATTQALKPPEPHLPLPNNLVAQFPNLSWIENIAVRHNGDLLLTQLPVSITTNVSLYTVLNPSSISPTLTPIQIHTFNDTNSLFGIAESATTPDLFVLVGGNLPTSPSPRTYPVWTVDFRGHNHLPKITEITKLTSAELPNGVAAIPHRDAVLVADSWAGLTWHVNIKTGNVSLGIQVPEMAPPSGSPATTVGINGVKIHKGYLYWTNSGLVTLYRVRIDAEGRQAQGSKVETVAKLDAAFLDDFAIGEDGIIWVATNVNNTLIAVRPDTGENVVVEGAVAEMTLAGDTAAAFGRGKDDGCTRRHWGRGVQNFLLQAMNPTFEESSHLTDNELSAAPALSTPADHLFEHIEPEVPDAETELQAQKLSDAELCDVYEIARTAREIRDGGKKRVGLQFPDHMLRDAPRVVGALSAELVALSAGTTDGKGIAPERIYILADTSYSACCVDEIAAEHANVDVVVHYGRSCLSPTSRLPVIYVFTQHKLDRDSTLAAFEKEFPDKDSKVVLMADVTYQDHVPALAKELEARGYVAMLSTEIVHDPMGKIPNRKIVSPTGEPSCPDFDHKEYSIFHISNPPTALFLALTSRVKSLHIHATSTSSQEPPSTQRLLGRRYARLLSLASAGVIGILVNTLSVSNYLASIDSIRKQIAAAGKKSYTVVVGKLNPAKLANFAEVDGWVVVGCWESSLVEDDAGFYRPVITPFELEVALAGDDTRTWTGEWWGGIEGVLKEEGDAPDQKQDQSREDGIEVGEDDSEEESAPPEFDLRTGRLISHSRPMRRVEKKAKAPSEGAGAANGTEPSTSSALALRAKAELATVNGVVSPGAEFLRSQRTWQGLGSDYTAEESTAIEEGRSGVARGYTVGEDAEKR
ncbi:putative diphthamide synthesis protein-domain-containing protein [Cercophora newfieldiana]|uniref:2-(3-amino-3-carboxypropyl)histidine synthase subunit 2 n=1 Tax=Cercophora newfieldiana TaxID=92897 RepID=A0AA39YB62_9PEZI|nr:putative diphthamide synthesis protein-domain-containing protein [Cercophora newfieldiana]